MKKKKNQYHGNDRRNKDPHHLYEIYDKFKEDTFKYGISADPIDENGLSERIYQQLSLYNLIAEVTRFLGRILLRNIPGRAKALELEEEHIKAYEKKHGHRPPGNPKRRVKRNK
ncbi:MAG: hypothetical protein IPN20_05015 [Haliscomenobacter sp.]|jgi:hypothetical protein|nr:hypothetical protein [Haliscomenobacter sp.]